ncbi:MAG: PSP1 domain-containing protein [Planctomycetota bacterium]|jgi:cell fate regulator YaaT (PSP1 superfamily)
MSKAAQTKPKQAKYKKYMLVRYSRMNTLGLFEHHETRIPKMDTRVVIKTNKGLELGYLVGQLSSYRAGQLKFDSDQIKKYFDDSNIDISIDRTGKFVRYATAADISEERHLQKIAEEEMECCRRFIKELNLPMKIVDAEHIFGGERVIFYFMSDGRVDFRELVKKIANEYQTRIEMRQIGSRDEAKILGDVESCGQQCCCQRFLKLLKPVNMRMAKMQKATLDPSKISGYCGRLKCCLRYEDKTYTELKKRLPKKNAKVKTRYGEGKVTDTQILTQLVMVELGDGQRVSVALEELEVISPPATAKKKKQNSTKENNQKDNRKSETDSQTKDNTEAPEQ